LRRHVKGTTAHLFITGKFLQLELSHRNWPAFTHAAQPIPKPNFDRTVPNFALKDVNGKVHNLSDYGDDKGVCITFLGLGCPLSNLYTPRLQSIADEEFKVITGLWPYRLPTGR